MLKTSGYIALSSLLISCATTQLAPPTPLAKQKENTKATKPQLALPVIPHEPKDRWNESLHAERYENNPMVQRWIAYYTSKGKNRFENILKRGNLYKKQIHSILKKFNLPTNFYYLALIESDFNVEARSPAKAAGIWQFMSPTAKSYGLRINEYIDERRDPWRSTVAAALYLKNLNNVFDSWFLAMSAYNAGESRIMNAIIRSGTRDFWKLCEIGFIPRETREYVPRFLAALLIGEHPERYNMEVNLKEEPNVVAVKIPTPVRLKSIAQITGLTLEEFRTYNPHILKDHTPPRLDSYRVWLPENNVVPSEALAQLQVIPTSELRSSKQHRSHHKKHKRSRRKSVSIAGQSRRH